MVISTTLLVLLSLHDLPSVRLHLSDIPHQLEVREREYKST